MSDQEQLPAEPLLKAGPEFHKEATKALEERAATLTAGAESGAIPTTTADIQGAVGLEAISPVVRSDAGLVAAQAVPAAPTAGEAKADLAAAPPVGTATPKTPTCNEPASAGAAKAAGTDGGLLQDGVIEPFTGEEILSHIHNYGPIFVFHDEEPFQPDTVDGFLNHCMHYKVTKAEGLGSVDQVVMRSPFVRPTAACDVTVTREEDVVVTVNPESHTAAVPAGGGVEESKHDTAAEAKSAAPASGEVVQAASASAAVRLFTKEFTSKASISDFLAFAETPEKAIKLTSDTGESRAFITDAEGTPAFKHSLSKGDTKRAKAYVMVKWWPGYTYTDYQFWIYCWMNGPATLRLCGIDIPFSIDGRHQSDLEHVTLRVSNAPGESRGKPLGIMFSYHTYLDWVPWESDLMRFETFEGAKRPVVFSSRNGHGMYWSPGWNPNCKIPPCPCPIAACVNATVPFNPNGRLLCAYRQYSIMECSFFVGGATKTVPGLAQLNQPAEWLKYRGRWGPIEHHWGCFLRCLLKPVMACFPNDVGVDKGPSGPRMKNGYYGREQFTSPFDAGNMKPGKPYFFPDRVTDGVYAAEPEPWRPSVLQVGVADVAGAVHLSYLPLSSAKEVVEWKPQAKKHATRGALILRSRGINLGDMFVYNDTSLRFHYAVQANAADPELFKAPTGFVAVVVNQVIPGFPAGIAFWKPIPPPGYTGLGLLTTTEPVEDAAALLEMYPEFMCLRVDAAYPGNTVEGLRVPCKAAGPKANLYVFCHDNPLRTFNVVHGSLGNTAAPFRKLLLSAGSVEHVYTPALTLRLAAVV